MPLYSFAATVQPTPIHQTLTSQAGWLNTSRPVTAEDLAGRIILVDFWTFCCINCMHVIPDLKYLEEKFGDKLTVIGVHSAKFKNEQDSENIRSAILRYGIEHPVVNDFDFSIWRKFGVRAWPTFVLINPKGMIEATYSGEGNREEAEADITELIEQYGDKLNTAPLPISLEKNKAPASVLSFPSKLAQGIWGGDATDTFPVLYVSDSGHHRVIALSILHPDPDNGNIIIVETIGSGREGFKDGSFEEAQFRRPQGIIVQFPYVYIADTENHALRRADLVKRTVETIAGTGAQGYERTVKNAPAREVPLASPWDLAFYPDDKHIAIAMAGTHQLWGYDIEKKTVSVIAGNGRESIDDGKYPFNSLSQPSGLAAHGRRLYFVDSETSSLRVYDNGEVTTLIGTGLFDFGYKDGKQGTARMQHPLGIYADDNGVYIADSYNHSIRHFYQKTGELSTYAGHGERGTDDGALATAEFNEPNDLVKIGDKFYVADTNNHAIRVIEGDKVSTLKVALTLPLSRNAGEGSASEARAGEGEFPEFSENLPNLEKLPPMEISGGGSAIKFGLKEGWHINDEAPSYLALFDKDKKPVVHYDLTAIKKGIRTPRLSPGTYRLQGTLYYCEEKAGAQCLIKSFDVELRAGEGKKEIELKLN